MCRIERALVAAALALGGCAGDSSPKGWLPDAGESQRSTEGGWIAIECKDEKGEDDEEVDEVGACAEGELIAVGPQGVEVLTRTGFVQVSESDMEEATLATYHTQYRELRNWTGFGVLSTLSHGYVALVSVPMWLFTGITAKEFERRAGLQHYPDAPLADFRAFARFPQGRPASVDPASLGPLRSTGPNPIQRPAPAIPAPAALSPVIPPAQPNAPPRAPVAAGESVQLRRGAMLRPQPRKESTGAPVDAAMTVVLKATLRNADGTWWFVVAAENPAWVLETDLDLQERF